MKKRISIDEIVSLIKEQKVKTCILDFDYTLTTLESSSSIGIFNNMINSKYRRKKHLLDLLTKYVKIKQVYYLIWKMKLKLLSKYNYKNYLSNIEVPKYFIPNDNMLLLIKKIMNLNIEIIIYSSGLKKIIEMFLEENKINKGNIKVIANSPENLNSIVTPFKNKLNIKSKCACFGDKKRDLKLVNDCIDILVNNDIFYIKLVK